MEHPDQDPDGATALPNSLFIDVRPQLTIAQWAVLMAIAFRVCWIRRPVAVSFSELATEANVDRRTVIRAVRVLERLGVIAYTPGGVGRRHVYRVVGWP